MEGDDPSDHRKRHAGAVGAFRTDLVVFSLSESAEHQNAARARLPTTCFALPHGLCSRDTGKCPVGLTQQHRHRLGKVVQVFATLQAGNSSLKVVLRIQINTTRIPFVCVSTLSGHQCALASNRLFAKPDAVIEP